MASAIRLHIPGLLAALGEKVRTHQRTIRVIQWTVVFIYLLLILVPVFLPLPDNSARIFNHLTLLAQFLFWGIWWPFVLLSMILVGRTWCGIFCPEGTLTEWASQHGRRGATPGWVKWKGWPFTAFCLTTLFGQLISVYQYPKAVLLILGGSTIGAMVIGFLYGKSSRVWCRYLCPVNGVFSLLSRLSPLYMRVDATRWSHPPQNKIIPIHCPPLVNVRHMQGPSQCHMCGRCSGYREAVSLAIRPPNKEIVNLPVSKGSAWDLLLLVYGLLGVAIGAFQWTASPWFIKAKQDLAEWVVNHNILWPLADNAPWWLLTHYPEQNDVFTWLDGATVTAYILITALVLGSWILFWLMAAAYTQVGHWWDNTVRLSYVFTPLAGCGVFIGLSALTFSLLKTEGIIFSGLLALRFSLLGLASIWTLWLAYQQSQSNRWRRGATVILLTPAVGAVLGMWYLLFVGW